MNTDDPKLTAFALDELDEPEKSTIARAVAESPEAQRVVDETREIARALKNEFAADMANEKPMPASRNLSDIRDDPWFWSIGRPLAIAAVLAIFALITGVTIVSIKNRSAERVVVTGSNIPAAEEAAPSPSSSEVEGQMMEEVMAPPPPAGTSAKREGRRRSARPA